MKFTKFKSRIKIRIFNSFFCNGHTSWKKSSGSGGLLGLQTMEKGPLSCHKPLPENNESCVEVRFDSKLHVKAQVIAGTLDLMKLA